MEETTTHLLIIVEYSSVLHYITALQYHSKDDTFNTFDGFCVADGCYVT